MKSGISRVWQKRAAQTTRTVAAALALAVCLSSTGIAAERVSAHNAVVSPPQTIELSAYTSKFTNSLYSPNAILISLGDGETLMMKNINQKVYPASMTKIMTALVAIENLPDLQAKTTLPASIFPDLKRQGASMAGFKAGEKVKAIDLLHGSLLPSGAEASIGLAYAVSGSEKAFAKKMNEKAKQLGMKHTNFVNSTGLPDTNHYTTVKDMSILMAAALKNPTFRKIVTTHKYSTWATDLHPKGMTLRSTLSETAPTLQFKGGRILGGKTGYTKAAGLCLASIAVKNGKEYLLVSAGAAGHPRNKPNHIQDALNVYGKLPN